MAVLSFPVLPKRVREMRRVFAAIHSARSWGECESASGPGSTRERAAAFLPDLIALLRRLRVAVLLDAPCGDFNWAESLADSVAKYIGIDVVPAVITANRNRWSSPSRRFLCRDLVRQRLPSADLVLCRDALVHLSHADALAALANLRRTGAQHLILTTFIGDRANPDIANGEWRPLNMEKSPFSLPPPLELVDERCHHSGGVYADKRLGLWSFRDLPAS
jgi:Methyltransferase domain